MQGEIVVYVCMLAVGLQIMKTSGIKCDEGYKVNGLLISINKLGMKECESSACIRVETDVSYAFVGMNFDQAAVITLCGEKEDCGINKACSEYLETLREPLDDIGVDINDITIKTCSQRQCDNQDKCNSIPVNQMTQCSPFTTTSIPPVMTSSVMTSTEVKTSHYEPTTRPSSYEESTVEENQVTERATEPSQTHSPTTENWVTGSSPYNTTVLHNTPMGIAAISSTTSQYAHKTGGMYTENNSFMETTTSASNQDKKMHLSCIALFPLQFVFQQFFG